MSPLFVDRLQDLAEAAKRIRQIERQFHGAATALVAGTSVNALGTVRSLRQAGIPVVWLTSNPRSYLTRTRFTSCVLCCEDVFSAKLVEALTVTMRLFTRKPVLFLTHDFQVKVVSEHRERLKQGFLFDLPQPEMVSRLMQKQRFHYLAQEHGLKVAETYAIGSLEELRVFADGRGATGQWVIKPPEKNDRFERFFGKALKVSSADQWGSVIERYSALDSVVLVQQWIAGPDTSVIYCLTVFRPAGTPVATYCVRKVRQYKPEVGTGTLVEGINDTRLKDLTLAFFTGCHYVGIGSLEFKYESSTNTYYVIEPTIGRTDMNGEVAALNGCNLPAIYYLGLTGQKHKRDLFVEQARRSRTNRAWLLFGRDFHAARHYIRERQLSVVDWLRSLMRPLSPAIFRLNDPVPFLVLLVRLCRHSVKTRLIGPPIELLSRTRTGGHKASGGAETGRKTRSPETEACVD